MTMRTLARLTDSGVLEALRRRLAAAADVLLPADGAARLAAHDWGSAGEHASELLPQLVHVAARCERPDARWLLLTALHGRLPGAAEVTSLGRRLELLPTWHVESSLLDAVLADPTARLGRGMVLVQDATVVDVDFCARSRTHSGIQRVVRQTVPRWQASHAIRLVAWDGPGFRDLSPRERARVLQHGEPAAHLSNASDDRLVVPWRTTVVLPDVPRPEGAPELVALSRYSGSTLGLVGYDMIPILSADVRPPGDAVSFAEWLTVVKHAHRLAGISASSTAEFAGFGRALGAQGLSGPLVREIRVADETGLAAPRAPSPNRARPVLLCVGSREPHKNQRAALHAAERLWREGVELEVRLLGGPGFSDAILRPAVDRLVAAGRPVTDLGQVSDAVLSAEMRDADAVFFASLHEGYGLPVTEALACGTPVITADFGAQAEVARAGGCLLVDPRDDDSIRDGIRRMVTDGALQARLRDEALARPVRTWDQYADELWTFLVQDAS
jgi:hypothetical protein